MTSFQADSQLPTAQTDSNRIQAAIYAFTRSRMLFTATDIGLFTHIAQGENTVAALAPLLNMDARALSIFMDALAGVEFLLKDGEQYALPDDVQHYLVAETPDYLGGMVTHGKRLYDNWSLLRDVLRSGLPAGGAQAHNHMEEYFAELIQGLYVSNAKAAETLAEKLSLDETAQILDVAAGSGIWSIKCLEKQSGAHATLLDYPRVVEVAKQYIQSHDLTQRYQYLPGDLELMTFPQAQYDIALVAHICHIIGAVASRRLIAHIAETLKPGGRIVIIDFLRDNTTSPTGWPAVFGLNLLISTDSGEVFSKAQYQQWLEDAGLTLTEEYALSGDMTALIAVKA